MSRTWRRQLERKTKTKTRQGVVTELFLGLGVHKTQFLTRRFADFCSHVRRCEYRKLGARLAHHMAPKVTPHVRCT